MFKSGALLTLGNLASAVTLMIRNILVARLITVADMGIASTFAITMALLEMLTDFALNQMLVQARDGDERRVKATLQTLQFIRGLITGALLYLVAGPYARLLGVPDVVWAFELLAIVPVLQGLVHLDIFQAQRRFDYRPFVVSTVAPQVISVFAVWPFVVWYGDYRVMLYAILVQQILYLVTSHLMAKERISFSWDVSVALRAFGFGWPLFLNGILMFAIFNGDRIIVANTLGIVALGLFAMAYTVTLAPTLVAGRTMQSFFLPQLSKVQDDRTAFLPLHRMVLEAYLLAGTAFAFALTIFGPAVFLLLLGEKYAPALPVLVWLGVMQALRLAKAGPAVVAMSQGRTKNALYANLVRIAFLPIAYVAIQITENVMSLALVALIGEGVALCAALWLLRRELDIDLAPVLPAYIAAMIVLMLITMDALVFPAGAIAFGNFHAAQLGLMAAFGIMCLTFRNLISGAKTLIGTERVQS